MFHNDSIHLLPLREREARYCKIYKIIEDDFLFNIFLINYKILKFNAFENIFHRYHIRMGIFYKMISP